MRLPALRPFAGKTHHAALRDQRLNGGHTEFNAFLHRVIHALTTRHRLRQRHLQLDIGMRANTIRISQDEGWMLVGDAMTGAGDELQGMKKGVIEIADLLAVNKADGDNATRAKLAGVEYSRVLHFLQPATPGWKTRCTTCSALIPETLAALWETIGKFSATTRESGAFAARRKHQSIEWMHAMIQEELHHRFFRDERVRQLLPEIERQVADQTLPAATAVRRIMDGFAQ